MLAVRVIPCLDVDAGRVVKGVQLRRDPRRRRSGRARGALRRRGRRRARVPRHHRVVATTATRWCTSSSASPSRCSSRSPSAAASARVDDVRRDAARRRRQGLAQHRGGRTIPTSSARAPTSSAPSASSSRSTPAGATPTTGAGWEVVTHGGRTPTGLDAVEWAVHACDLGAGEILLTSMDRDGTKAGYDIELLQAVGDAVDVPVIASGGVGTLEHLCEGVDRGRRRRGARRLDLPLRPAHGARGQGRPGRRGASPSARNHRPVTGRAR